MRRPLDPTMIPTNRFPPPWPDGPIRTGLRGDGRVTFSLDEIDPHLVELLTGGPPPPSIESYLRANRIQLFGEFAERARAAYRPREYSFDWLRDHPGDYVVFDWGPEDLGRHGKFAWNEWPVDPLPGPICPSSADPVFPELHRGDDRPIDFLYLDGGTLDMGIIRSVYGWRSLRHALLRPWRWHKIPTIVATWGQPIHGGNDFTLFYETFGTVPPPPEPTPAPWWQNIYPFWWSRARW